MTSPPLPSAASATMALASTTPSGLIIEEVIIGQGAAAQAGRLAIALHWNEAAPNPSSSPVRWLTRAYARDTTDATITGLLFDPRLPFGAPNYCINTAVQFYRPKLGAIGHNIRLSEHTWDPQLSAPHPECICTRGTFIGDYFGVDSRGGYTYTASVETYNAGGENPGFHQQQLVSKLRTP